MKQKLSQLLLMSSIVLLIVSCKKSIEKPFYQEKAKAAPSSELQSTSLESGPSRAFSINNSGAIAGSATDPDGKIKAFNLKNNDLWYSTDEVKPNGLPEIKFSINEPGDIAGSKISGTGILPMLWRHGQAYELSPLPGQQFGEVYDINNSGVMVGESLNGNFVTPTTMRATVFSLEGDPIDLGTLGGTKASAASINDFGHIVGVADNALNQQRAFLYKDGVMQDLGTLGGIASNANAINNYGEIAGRSLLSNGAIRAFLYKEGVMYDLGTLGGAASVAFGINDKGEVVGFARIATGQAHAFLYKDGVMYDLGTNGGTESRAYGINNRGDVVGQYTNADGSVHGFVYRDGQMYSL
ncbi:MAG: HAF repeat-containing protein [Bacteroidetes bacterium]|nr:MAG: HAF repeat-containing protein [Bacteroidota bacterium]